MEEISAKPQLMGDIFAVTPTSCANYTPAVESLVGSSRRVEVNSIAELSSEEEKVDLTTLKRTLPW